MGDANAKDPQGCGAPMGETIFDAIIRGDIPAAKVYEDDRVLAFLDISPLREGHTLVIPKESAAKLNDLSAEDAGGLMVAAQRILPGLLAAVGADDATLAIHDGPAAGQEVPHVHLHIVPRKAGDGGGPIHALFPDRPSAAPDSLTALAERVRGAVEAA